MIPLGLSAADTRALRSTLTKPHRMRVTVEATKLDGTPAADLTPYVDGGQIDVDATQDVTRALTLTLHDEGGDLPFDTDHPAETALFLDRMVRVRWHVLVGDEWRTVPVFRGPVNQLSRDGDVVSLGAQGGEAMLLGAAWQPMTLHKGMLKTDAIKRILREGNPAYRYPWIDVPDLSAKLPKAIGVARDDRPWKVAAKIARSMGRQLFCDGNGTVRLRKPLNRSVFKFSGSHVTTPPKVAISDRAVNAVRVEGDPSRKLVAWITAPPTHVLAPHRIGRYLLPDGKVIRNDALKTDVEVGEVAIDALRDGLRQGVDATFDAIPVPLLDPLDLIHVETGDGSVEFRLKQFSLPLVVGDSMTVGYTRDVSLWRARRS